MERKNLNFSMNISQVGQTCSLDIMHSDFKMYFPLPRLSPNGISNRIYVLARPGIRWSPAAWGPLIKVQRRLMKSPCILFSLLFSSLVASAAEAGPSA